MKPGRRILIHLIGTHKNGYFQTLLDKTSLSLPVVYGLFWLLMEEIGKSIDMKIHINDVPPIIPIDFVNAVIDSKLLEFDGNFLSSRFICRRYEELLARKEKRRIQAEEHQEEIEKLTNEVERLQKLLKLKIKR